MIVTPATVANASQALRPAVVAAALAGLTLLLVLAGLSAGSQGWSLAWMQDAAEWELVAAIRAPRTMGALAVGALLGLAGAVSQGLFRNPLADPYLLGSAAGAGLGVTLVLAASSGLGAVIGLATATMLQRLGLVTAAFGGAVLGVLLTLLLARGTGRPMVLLLAGVVVGILMSALSEALMLVAPEALRGRQIFLLGTTAFLGWGGVVVLVGVGALVLPVALRHARALDALVLGEDSAASLGLNLGRVRAVLVLALAAATGAAVAQAGLVAFVGLVAPHIVRRLVLATHGPLLFLSAATGGVLLLAADVAARSLLAPQELPVGLLTAVLGGVYLLVLLRRHGRW